MGAGSQLYVQGLGVASLSLSPQVPNAAIVRRILFANESAPDIWVVRTNGQEVGRFSQSNDFSLQPVLGPFEKGFAFRNDIFSYCHETLGIDLIYPVPEGKTITISSEGGATADIAFEYEEFAASALNPSLVNYPGGNYWIAPAWGYLNAHPTLPGDYALDTEVSLDFAPNVFVRGSFPVGWQVRILDLFLYGSGVNTYNGSADHQSVTQYLSVKRSGQRLFTRDNTGIPIVGEPSNSGSANVSGDAILQGCSPFDVKKGDQQPNLDAPLIYRPGYVYEWAYGITGDLTGGADYSGIRQLAIVEYRSV